MILQKIISVPICVIVVLLVESGLIYLEPIINEKFGPKKWGTILRHTLYTISLIIMVIYLI